MVSDAEFLLLLDDDGQAAAFSPADIENLYTWLDSSDASTLWQDSAKTTLASSFGDVIGNWEDKSGNGRDATQSTTANKPLRQSGGITGDGINDLLSKAISAGTVKTAIIVAREITPVAGGRLWGFNTSASFLYSSSAISYFDPSVVTSTDGSVRSIASIRYTDLDNAEIDTNSSADNLFNPNDVFNTSTSISLFNRAAADRATNTEINEFITYSRALSDAELSQIFDYLSAKWSVTLS